MKTIISTDKEFQAELIDAHDKIERGLTVLIGAPIVLSKALDLLLEEYDWGNGPKWREETRKAFIRKAVRMLDEEDKK